MTTGNAQNLRETNRIFEEEVVGKGDFGALDRVYTRGARILPPGAEMISGLDQIRAFWKQAATAMGVTSLKLTTVDVEFLGETAVEIGRATISTSQSGVPGSAEVKYVVVWKREDGSWKWHTDIWNPVS